MDVPLVTLKDSCTCMQLAVDRVVRCCRMEAGCCVVSCCAFHRIDASFLERPSSMQLLACQDIDQEVSSAG